MNTDELKQLGETLIGIAEGKEWQWQSSKGEWVGAYQGLNPLNPLDCLDCLDCFGHHKKIRLKPETVKINGHVVPAPYRGELQEGWDVYEADPTTQEYCHSTTWRGSSKRQLETMRRGLIHLTAEAAAAHGRALASFTERSEA